MKDWTLNQVLIASDPNISAINAATFSGGSLNFLDPVWVFAVSFFVMLFGFLILYLYDFDFRMYALLFAVIFLVAYIIIFLTLQTICVSYSHYILIVHAKLINIMYMLECDALSMSFVILTAFLFLVCLLLAWNVKYKVKSLYLVLFSVKILLINLFCVTDLFLFYVFFEATLIPMFLLIGIWGSRERKYYASYQFLIYTLFGSLFMLGSILWIHAHFGVTDFRALSFVSLTLSRQLILWLAFFFAIAVKVPMMPVHLWLPEAHVEAPTVGSVLLAGVLLKLGTYALIRFVFPLFPEASLYFAPVVLAMAGAAVIFSSLTTLMQIDMKKMVAYSSVAHMNFVVLGLFTFNFPGYIGSIILMLSHGIVSSALFICVGVLYDRYKTRLLVYFGGLARLMPLFTFMFFAFSLGNMAFPGTFSFIGEFLILLGLFLKNPILGVIAGLSVVFSAGYSLVLYSHTVNGQARIFVVKFYSDLILREVVVLSILFVLMVFLGIKPMFLLNYFDMFNENINALSSIY